MKTFQFRIAVLLAAALSPNPYPGASAQEPSKDWVSTEWEVWCPIAESPDVGHCEGQETAAEVFRGYLESASQWYESLGFRGPKVVTKFEKYQAQIMRSKVAYDPDGDSFAGMYDPTGYWIYLNEDNFFALGEPGQTTEAAKFRVEQSYIFTSVHEVFHAIQATYSDFACGEGRGWMCEGMADAALRAYADKFEGEMNIAMERRPYHEPLHQPSKKEWRYGTWQFWLDVGRHLNSTDGIGYFRDILQKDLAPHNGLMGVDHGLKDLMAGDDTALWETSGLFELLPWFFAKRDPASIFHEPLRRSFRLEAGQTVVEKRITNIAIQPVAGRAVELTIDRPADTPVGVRISFSRPDDDLHLIVDKVRYDKTVGEGRNVFFTVSGEEQQLKFDVVIANVAKAAQMSRKNSTDLVVELTADASWVRLNGETFRVKAGICNHAGVTAGPVPDERSIMFVIYSPGGETRVDWGTSGVSADLFANGCEWSDWPPCISDLTGSAGGPRSVGNNPKRFDVDMDYDMKQGIWSGAGHLYSDRSGQVDIEFFIQCDAANRSLMR